VHTAVIENLKHTIFPSNILAITEGHNVYREPISAPAVPSAGKTVEVQIVASQRCDLEPAAVHTGRSDLQDIRSPVDQIDGILRCRPRAAKEADDTNVPASRALNRPATATETHNNGNEHDFKDGLHKISFFVSF